MVPPLFQSKNKKMFSFVPAPAANYRRANGKGIAIYVGMYIQVLCRSRIIYRGLAAGIY
jgi:hypothetical protein